MAALFSMLGWLFAGLAVCGALYALAIAMLAGRVLGTKAAPPAEWPAVSILKPLHFDEPLLADNLQSFCEQDYPAPVQIVFGVQDPNDTAIDVVRALKARHPARRLDLVIDARAHGANHKVSNLLNMLPCARHDVLIISDSDIAVPRSYLRHVVSALAQPGIGAVTCLYTGKPVPDLWSRLMAQGINYQFLVNVLFGTFTGLATPCFGSTIALRRAVLVEIGGLEAFADCLADDYEIGRAVRQKGYGVALPPLAVEHVCAEPGWRQFLDHELRWARTIRTVDPAGHWGSAVTHAVPMGLLAALCSGFALYGLGVLALALACRFVLKWRVDRLFGGYAASAWLFPLRDVLSFGVFVVSLFGGRVRWRGSRFEVSPDGVLSRS